MKELLERFKIFESITDAFTVRDSRAIGDTIKAVVCALTFYLTANSMEVYSPGVLVYMTAMVLFLFFVAFHRAIGFYMMLVALALYTYRFELLLLFLPAFFLKDYFFEKQKGFFFILLVLSLMASKFSLEISAVLLAVFFLGANAGVMAGMTVFALQVMGLMWGKPIVGIVYSVANKPLLPEKPNLGFDKFLNFSDQWDHITRLDVGFISDLALIYTENVFLLAQPVVWGLIAMLGGRLVSRTYKGLGITYFMVAASLVLTQQVFGGLNEQPLELGQLAAAGGWSFLLATALTLPTLIISHDIFGMRATGQIETRMPQAVLVIDIVGSTMMGEKYGDVLTLKIKDRLDKLVHASIRKYNHMFIKGTGDGYLITFPDSNRACQAAMDIMNKNEELKGRVEEIEQIDLKMGLAFGEVTSKEGDIHGGIVNLAFRVQGTNSGNMVDISEAERDMPEKNCLLANESVVEDLAGRFEIDFLGYFEAKGVMGRHKLFSIGEKGKENNGSRKAATSKPASKPDDAAKEKTKEKPKAKTKAKSKEKDKEKVSSS